MSSGGASRSVPGSGGPSRRTHTATWRAALPGRRRGISPAPHAIRRPTLPGREHVVPGAVRRNPTPPRIRRRATLGVRRRPRLPAAAVGPARVPRAGTPRIPRALDTVPRHAIRPGPSARERPVARDRPGHHHAPRGAGVGKTRRRGRVETRPSQESDRAAISAEEPDATVTQPGPQFVQARRPVGTTSELRASGRDVKRGCGRSPGIDPLPDPREVRGLEGRERHPH